MNGNASHAPKPRLLRLHPLPLSSIPSHPILAPHQTNTTPPPPLSSFLADTLTAAHAFMTTLLPAEFTTKGSPRPSAPASAQVELLTTEMPGSTASKPETWFARRSTHDDQPAAGTADWDEFFDGLYVQHSEKEVLYTPDVYDAVEVVNWRELIAADVRAALQREGWAQVHMEIYEMAHKIPAPFSNRVFAVLVVGGVVHRGAAAGDSGGGGGEDAGGGGNRPGEFITAQIPVEIDALKEAMYSNGRHKKEGSTAQKQAKCVIGQYVSVERAAQRELDGKVVWEMATCSDAKGWLPASVQKMGIPGAIIKDVGFFMRWVDTQRKKGGKA